MAQAQGSKARITYEVEATFGKTPAGTGAKKLTFRSEGIREKIPLISNDSIRGNRNPVKPVRGNRDVAGPISVNLCPQIGTLLRCALGSVTTTGSGPYTHTIKVSDLPSLTIEKGFTDLGKYLVFNGIKINRLSVNASSSGYQETSLDTIGANEARVLKYDAQSGNFTAGLTVTGGTSAATGKIVSDQDNGTTGFLTLRDVTGTFQDNETITDTGTGSATVDGTLGGASYTTNPTDPGETPFDGLAIGTVEEGGSAIAIVTGVDGITIENNIDGTVYTVGGGGIRPSLSDGKTRITGTLTALFDSMTLYEKALGFQESSLKIKWQHGNGGGTAGNESLEMYLPELVYDKETPVIEGDKGVLYRGPFEAYYENGSGASAMHLVLKNSEATI